MVGYGGYCVFFWVGDSRIYRLRGGAFLQLSQDHTYAEELVKLGMLHPDDASSHPERNTLSRGVGAAENLHVDFDYCEIEDGDIYLLCSDGLQKEVTDSEVSEVLVQSDIDKSVADLIELTLEREARDNVTAVAVLAEKRQEAAC